MFFYSASTRGFYDSSVHEELPDDAVEITNEYRIELGKGESAGKVISADKNGYPVLIDRPAPTSEALAATVRSKRDRLLLNCDWTQGKDISDAIATAWKPYRKALRDITDQPGFPENIMWPEAPAG